MVGTNSRRASVGHAYSPFRALMVVLLPVSRLFGRLIRFNPHKLSNISLFPESPPWRKSMKLRRNQYCPIHRSRSCCGRELVQKASKVRRLGVQRIEDPHHPRGYRELRSKAEMGNCSIDKSLSRTGNAPSARWRSPTITTSCPTTLIREGWEDRAETTIRRTFRQCTSGATVKRDPRGSTSDGRSALLW